MGIDGLLNLLKPVTQKQHISSFKDKTVAVDAMPWIYKGCYSCAMQLNQNIQSIDFLYYILEMLDMLSYYNIKPIFVFDGRAIYAKNDTLQKRKKSKEENKQKGLQFLKNNQLQQAKKYLSRCIIIDQRIITMTVNALVTKNIEFIVAPYEADCQIAKLKRMGMIDAVISQDSDLIAFGVNVILKLNQNGQCDYVDLNKWRPRDVSDVFLKYFLAFDEMSRIDAAILAGSDYNQSVKGIGIKRAVKLLTTQVTMNNVINKLKYKKAYMSKVPQDYEKTVQRSKLIFNLSTVYNPVTKQLQFLQPELVNELKPEQMSIEQLRQIVGRHYEYTEQVASGRVSSKTLQRRDIKTLNFPQIFRVNKQNMNAHQAATKKRKIEEQQLRQLRSLESQNGNEQNINSNDNEDLIFEQLSEFKRRAGRELTQEQIQKRKQQRKNRINKLQELMNTLVDVFGDSDQEEQVFGGANSEDQREQTKRQNEEMGLDNSNESNKKSQNQNKEDKNNSAEVNKDNNNTQISKNNINDQKFQTQKKVSSQKAVQNTAIKHKTPSSLYPMFNISSNKKSSTNNKISFLKNISHDSQQQKNFIEEQQSLSQDLAILNPFIKKDANKHVIIKTQHLNGNIKSQSKK